MSNHSSAFEQSYQGEPAVWLRYGDLEAAVLPGVGANLIAYRDKANNYHFLREPEEQEMDQFRSSPGTHGIPVLFPPNRYEDGTFTWNGRTYNFPINEPETQNHLHGFLHTIVWDVDHYEANDTESRVALRVSIDESHPVYTYWPHSFVAKLVYTLSADGLQQQITIQNLGNDPMPMMLAFHTAINAPFASGSTADDVTFRATFGQRRAMSERMLPTGKFQPLSDWEAQLKGEGANPYGEVMDNHYTAEPQNGRNIAEVIDHRLQVKLVYDVGTAYKHWMIWNSEASGSFLCPEPQTNLVNAPNVDLSDEEKGFMSLKQGEIWEETSRLYVVNNR